jgi:alpha-2-macroglobulin
LLLDADATVAAAALAEAGLLGDQALAEPLRRLVAAQQRDGGWGWWPSSPSEPFITSRVALALGVAPDDSVPQTAIEAAQGFLRRALTEAESPQLRAFLLEGLAALDEPDLAAARQLGREADALDSDALVALLLALHRENAADPQLVAVLAARAQRAGDGVFWAASTRAPGDQAAVTARALRALRAVAPASPLIEPARRFLLDQYRYHGWGNSYASTRAIEALAQPVPAPARAYRYVVALNGMELLARNASTALTATEQIPLDAVDLEASNDLTVTRDEIEGELLVAYRLRTPRDAQPGGQFALQRSYLDPRTGAALDLSQLRLGALVEVRLTLVVPRAQEFLVVEDALPAAAALVLPSYGLSPFEAAYLAETQLRIYAGRLDPGVHEHRYLARLVAAGSFVAPAPRARLVYTPLAVGDGVTQRLVVRAP